MIETMYDAPGIGLAAPQVGVGQRIAVMEMASEEDEQSPIVMINPEILWTSDETDEASEGCLSFPGHFCDITRPSAVEVRYMDLKGQIVENTLERLQARCAQHEIDHLNGKLFIDHISRLKRGLLVKKFKKELAAGKHRPKQP